mgnify:CR=1 FL=1
MQNGRINDFYKQFEELNKKLDKLIDENSKLSLTIYNQNLTIERLTKELEKANKLNEKLQEENDRLKNKNNKNSSNSSKPSSTDIGKPKKSGANLYNYRTKTNNKPGGQIGHKGHNLSKEEIERKIKNKELKEKTIYHIIKGNSKKEPLIKYKIELAIKPYVEKHIFKYDENSNYKLPKEYKTDVTYGNSIKSLYIELGAYNVISYNRFSDFLNVITNGLISISEGTLVNFIKEFSNKSKLSIDNLIDNILNGVTTYTDETTSKFCEKNMYVRNYSNEETVVYKAHLNKGHEPIKEDEILTEFLGGIIGDHDTTLYSYGTKNYECNIHLGRYLEELKQNIPDTLWPFKMYELLFRINNTRKIAKEYNLDYFSKDKIREYEDEYDEIIELAKLENKKISSSFYKEKSNKLLRRLIKYKSNHLYFIKDFNVPFDNNLSERDLRIFKTKTKISGGFRSIEIAKCYVDILSIIKTSIKRNINPFDSIKDIFDNEILFSN